jgi:hypothetical protein
VENMAVVAAKATITVVVTVVAGAERAVGWATAMSGGGYIEYNQPGVVHTSGGGCIVTQGWWHQWWRLYTVVAPVVAAV